MIASKLPSESELRGADRAVSPSLFLRKQKQTLVMAAITGEVKPLVVSLCGYI